MNILFFLTPKNEVAYIHDTSTLRQGLEKMHHYGYTAIPVIGKNGEYVGTVTEGDFLWTLTQHLKYDRSLDEKETEHISISEIVRKGYHPAVNANAAVEDLLTMAMNQNFVPVVDDRNSFIGIVTRKDILQYYYSLTHNE